MKFDFSTYACYSSIDKEKVGYLSKDNLGKHLVSNGYFATERELSAIMRRMDVDGDGKVLYGDFSEYIKPRIEWKEREVLSRRQGEVSPRWNAETSKMLTLAEVEERKSPQRGTRQNTEIKIYADGSPNKNPASRF